jgi:hypothetical protein
MERRSAHRASIDRRTSVSVGSPPSSARRSLPPPTDEDVGPAVLDPDEAFLQLGDGDDWPAHWGAARIATP